MEPKPISVQLYSVREAMQADAPGTLKRIAGFGYAAVEPAGFYGYTPKDFRALVADLGMTISSAHGVTPFNMSMQEAIDTAGILGINILCGGYGPAEFATLDKIKETAEQVNGVIEPLAAAGLSLMLHNHYWEFAEVEGRLAYDWFAELCPRVQFELDTYWASNFGANNVAEQVAKFKHRIPYLHIKDGPLTKDQPMTAVGKGKMDFPTVIAAADPQVLRWLVVELDACATDMMEAVADSYTYLVSHKLASGTRAV